MAAGLYKSSHRAVIEFGFAGQRRRTFASASAMRRYETARCRIDQTYSKFHLWLLLRRVSPLTAQHLSVLIEE
jgi:hypothetical protein